MRQQLANLTRPLRRQPRQHILQIGIQVMPIHPSRLDQTHDRRRLLATAQRPGKQSVRASKCPRLDLVLDPVVIDEHCAAINVASQRCHATQTVVQHLGSR